MEKKNQRGPIEWNGEGLRDDNDVIFHRTYGGNAGQRQG